MITETRDERGLMTASVIVVSFNTKELTLNCLESIHRETSDLPFELIVVDNDSSDGSAEAIREAFPAIQLHALDQNLGFAAANNLAGRHARGRFLVLLNPDTVVRGRAIERIVRYAIDSPESGIVGGRTIFADGSLNPTSCWAAPSLWSLFCQASCLRTLLPQTALFDPESMGKWARDSEREVDVVSGCFLLIPKSLWDELEGFDESYFMYGEDLDLNLRAKRLGYTSRITPEATVVHFGGASEPVKEDKLVRLLTAERRIIRTHWSPMKASIGLALQLLGVAVRATGAVVLSVTASAHAYPDARSWRGVWRRRGEWR